MLTQQELQPSFGQININYWSWFSYIDVRDDINWWQICDVGDKFMMVLSSTLLYANMSEMSPTCKIRKSTSL